MGCTSSREKDPGSGEVYEKRKCGGDNDDFLTERQKTLVRETWLLLSDDLISRGSMIFLYIFNKRPSAKELFPFRNVEGEALLKNAMFKGHGKRFMHAVETTVQNLDALDIILVPTLYMLGKRHAYITDIFVDYQAVFKDAIIATFEQELGSACTPEVRVAWTLLFEFIGNKLLEGYDVGMKEKSIAESKEDTATGAAQEIVTADREGSGVDATTPVCRIDGDVTLTNDTVACPVGQRSSMKPSCKLPDERSTNPASVVERTGDVATVTDDTATTTTTTRSDLMAPLATLDEIPTTPTTPRPVVDTADVELVATASMCPWAASDGVQAAFETRSVDVRQSSPTTEGTNDVESKQTYGITTTPSGNDQTATSPVVQADTVVDTCNSSCVPAIANSIAQSPQTPTDHEELNDMSNSVKTTPDNDKSSTGCPGDCTTTINDITLTTVDHNSNGGLQCNVYSGCNGTNVIVDGNDVNRLLQANMV